MSKYSIQRAINVAMGDGATFNNGSPSPRPADVDIRLDQLDEAVRATGDHDVAAQVDGLRSEVTSGAPDKQKILERLLVITTAAGAVTAVATAAAELSAAVHGWL